MRRGERIKKALFSLLLGAEAAVLADLAGLVMQKYPPLPLLLAVFLAAAALAFFGRARARTLGRLFAAAAGAGLAVVALCAGTLVLFARGSGYAGGDEGKAALFGEKTVLVVAPHEDDELNVAGGLVEEFLRCGSRVRLAFATNGDYDTTGERRLREALAAASEMGVREEDVIFLGYGDGKNAQGQHLYTMPMDEPFISAAGYGETYGLPEHPAYNEGNLYTRRHFCEDLRDLILETRPDLILCTGYETHADHSAVCLFTEEVLAGILRTEPDYRPVLLESLSYATAYYAPEDFYSPNILSIQNPFGGQPFGPIPVYEWEGRVRLPVSEESLARSVFGSSTYWQLRCHGSQGAVDRAERIINGDKVFWLRDTNSLSYGAQVRTSSGDASLLNDFKLLDTADISAAAPWDGTWVPESGDTERRAELIFPQAADLTELRLYDNPSLTDNVLRVSVSLDGGEPVELGPLKPNGAASVFPLEAEGVTRLELRLLETEGEGAGLTELEVCKGQQASGLDFLKLQNLTGDFVYDYYIDPGGQEAFTVYASGAAQEELSQLRLSCEGEGCQAELRDGQVLVSCPRGKSCTVTLSSADGRYTDTARISNPSPLKRGALQSFEAFMSHRVFRDLAQLSSYRLLRSVYRLLRYGPAAV